MNLRKRVSLIMTLPSAFFVYIGTYSQRGSKGIYTLRFDPQSGTLTPVGATDPSAITNPSFLTLHPSRPYLYAVSEVSSSGGRSDGAVAAFRVEETTGALTPLGSMQTSGGTAPCFITCDPAGKNVLVANYGSGSVEVLPLKDGALQPPSATIQHTHPSKVNAQRQEGPHAHSIHVDTSGRFAIACDLGCDKLFQYRFDAARGTLTPNTPPAASTPPGAGPRQFAFPPSAPFAYVVNELDSTVLVLSWDKARGTLRTEQSLSALPPGYTGKSACAEIQVHPTGRWVYASNRGHDSIAVFAVEGSSGRLRLMGHTPTGGKVPRHFGIDPSGRFLIAANQDTDNLVVFRIDAEHTGALTPTGQTAAIPAPVCVVFRPISSS